MSILYNTLYNLCKSKGITGAKMCNDIGVSKSLMTSLKSGRTSTINSKTAQKIADYFSVPVDSVLNPDTLDVDGPQEIQVVENRQKKEPAEYDGLTEGQRALIDFAKSLSENQAALALRVLKSLVETD